MAEEQKPKRKRFVRNNEFYDSVSRLIEEKKLFKDRNEVPASEIIDLIAYCAGDTYRSTSGQYLLGKWLEKEKDHYTKEVSTSPATNRNISVIVPIKKESECDDRKILIRNLVNVIDKQLASRDGKLHVLSLRKDWEGDEGVTKIALLCKAAKDLRAFSGEGFFYDHDREKQTVRILDVHKLRERLIRLLPPSTKKKEEKEEKTTSTPIEDEFKLNQFVIITDQAKDLIYQMGAILNKERKGIEVFSLLKYIKNAPTLLAKDNVTVQNVITLIKSVGKEYFSINGGSNIVSLNIGAWDMIKTKFKPEDRLIEVLVIVKDKEALKKTEESISYLHQNIGMLLTNCSWASYKKIARYVYSGKLELPENNKALEEKMKSDIESDLQKLAEANNPWE